MTTTPNLLAAAPDLYSAVTDWLEYLEGDGVDSAAREDGLLKAMHSAAAKARKKRCDRQVRIVVEDIELCGKCCETWLAEEVAAAEREAA